MSKLLWISAPGNEYQAMIRTLTIIIKALPDGRYLLMDSKPGEYYRRERSVIEGPLENAMERVDNRYLV